jgi:dihydroorotate dehydrogenase
MASLRFTLTTGKRRIQLAPRSSRSFASAIESASPFRRAAYLTLFALTASLGTVYYFDSRAAIHRYLVAPVIRHALDPESSHKLAVSVLESGLGPRDMLTDDGRLKTEVKCLYTTYSPPSEHLTPQLWGQTLSNPIGIAAGFDKDGRAIDGMNASLIC